MKFRNMNRGQLGTMDINARWVIEGVMRSNEAAGVETEVFYIGDREKDNPMSAQYLTVEYRGGGFCVVGFADDRMGDNVLSKHKTYDEAWMEMYKLAKQTKGFKDDFFKEINSIQINATSNEFHKMHSDITLGTIGFLASGTDYESEITYLTSEKENGEDVVYYSSIASTGGDGREISIWKSNDMSPVKYQRFSSEEEAREAYPKMIAEFMKYHSAEDEREL